MYGALRRVGPAADGGPRAVRGRVTLVGLDADVERCAGHGRVTRAGLDADVETCAEGGRVALAVLSADVESCAERGRVTLAGLSADPIPWPGRQARAGAGDGPVWRVVRLSPHRWEKCLEKQQPCAMFATASSARGPTRRSRGIWT